MPSTITPGSLVQLVARPVELASALPTLEPPEVAAACDRLLPADAARVLAALPPQLAARVLDEDSLSRPEQLIAHLGDEYAATLLDGVRPPRRQAILRAAAARDRSRLRAHLDPEVRREAGTAGIGALPPQQAPPVRSAPPTVRRFATAIVPVVVGALALVALHRELRAVSYHDLARSAAAMPHRRLWLALLITAAGYATLAAQDLLALAYVGRRIPARRALFASFISYAMSQNVGFSAITGASVRFRFWSGWGLPAPDIVEGVTFTTVTFWVGVLSVGGTCLLFGLERPWVSAPAAGLLRAGGVALLAIVASYVAWASLDRQVRSVRGWAVRAPGARLAAGQLLLSSLDWLLAALVLRVLLPAAFPLSFPAFMGIFLAAQVAGVLSHVPGGMGVFEGAMVLLLRSTAPAEAVLGALLAYRAIYYFLPFALAVAAFAGHEIQLRRAGVARVLRVASRWVPASAPLVVSTATFAAGLVLLFSGATPSLAPRMHRLHAILPLGLLELSHFTASIAGIALVLLARGVRQRLDVAWHLTLVVLAVGIVASLLKGLDYEEASLLAIALAGVAASRRSFTRRAALTSAPLTPGWLAAVLLALGATAWLGAFSFKHVGYSSELWWQFALHGDAPRFLRAMVGASVVAAAGSLWTLVRPARVRPLPPTPEEFSRVRQIVDASAQASANLALLGDKSLFFGANGGFVMYGVEGRSWIALGDPVAATAEERAELAWRFRETAYRDGGWPVFYQVSRESLELYVDLGLTLLKLGESAVVPLTGFSLEGPERRALRRGNRDAERAGCQFEVVPSGAVRALLPELRVVSDAWLRVRRAREKGFSLGRFDEEYLAHFPVAVVRRAGEVVAFTNLWTTASHEELSVDLMRHLPDAPPGTMDFLFAQVMLWGAREGYARFDLGMAPLSGFEGRALAPSWHRVARTVFALGEHFYNFEGLRRYKEKFRPTWEPRYLAAPGGLHLPRVLANVAALVGGGLTGVVSR